MKFNNNRQFISLYIKVASFLIHLFICDIVRIIFSNTRCGLVEPTLFASLLKLLQ